MVSLLLCTVTNKTFFMETAQRIAFLFNRYVDKTITATEFDELLVWMHGLDEEQAQYLSYAQQALWQKAKTGELQFAGDTVNWPAMLDRVLSHQETEQKPVHRLWPRLAAAAIILVLLGAGGYYWFSKKPVQVVDKPTTQPALRQPEAVLPLTNATVLTLPDGKQIVLDSAANGQLPAPGATPILKVQNGEIAYTATAATASPEYHTIQVPRGGRPYQVVLADGSRIWLNAASSLRYPSFFTGRERSVELTGEGYFEIAKNAAKPFIVTAGPNRVEVLGTHFNINSYADEDNITTTLLEGKVKVGTKYEVQNTPPQASDLRTQNAVVLQPGEQSMLTQNGQLQVHAANTALATAWVHGYFQFDKANLSTILRQVGRWYDLDIVYRGRIPDDLFSGRIERSLPLSGIVQLLARGNIRIKIEGKQLVVE
jgi:transmembrane sensor